jgi:hypothetical protein
MSTPVLCALTIEGEHSEVLRFLTQGMGNFYGTDKALLTGDQIDGLVDGSRLSDASADELRERLLRSEFDKGVWDFSLERFIPLPPVGPTGVRDRPPWAPSSDWPTEMWGSRETEPGSVYLMTLEPRYARILFDVKLGYPLKWFFRTADLYPTLTLTLAYFELRQRYVGVAMTDPEGRREHHDWSKRSNSWIQERAKDYLGFDPFDEEECEKYGHEYLEPGDEADDA